MGGSSENAGFLELSGKTCGPTSSQNILKDYPELLPSLEQPLISSCFVNSRSWDDVNPDFCPLRQANAELKAEHSSLLLKNSELLSQTLLLKLENQHLKRQLELRVERKHLSASFSMPSSVSESLTDSDMEDEGHLSQTSSDGASSVYSDKVFTP